MTTNKKQSLSGMVPSENKKLTLREQVLSTIHQNLGEVIDGFFGDYRFLSNFHLVDINYEGITYPSAENAYAACKTYSSPEYEEIKKHISTLSPKDAKAYGRKIPLRDKWEEKKFKVMEEILRIKFAKGTELYKKLKETDSKELIEENYWNDQIWGQCRGKGQNMLGKILMKIRDEK